MMPIFQDQGPFACTARFSDGETLTSFAQNLEITHSHPPNEFEKFVLRWFCPQTNSTELQYITSYKICPNAIVTRYDSIKAIYIFRSLSAKV